jgi:hypothetical protein
MLSDLGISVPTPAGVVKGMFLVPFPQNTAFVGRRTALERLERILRPEPDRQRRAALWGLGGIG